MVLVFCARRDHTVAEGNFSVVGGSKNKKEVVMKIARLAFPLIAVLALACFALSCGSGRRLQSISISQTTNGAQITFVATGTFSAPPTTVTPLPVNWGIGPFAPPPPRDLDYALTTQPYVFNCTGSGPYLPVTAFAPSDPNAPTTGSWPWAKMVTGLAAIPCP